MPNKNQNSTIKNFRFCLYVLLVLSFAGCHRYSAEVRFALQEAGDRKHELITVLEHYRRTDRKKFQAASFLIANIPFHGSREEIVLDPAWFCFFAWLDSIYVSQFVHMPLQQIRNYRPDRLDSLRMVIAQRYDALPPPTRKPGKRDIDVITAAFLIDHIDDAFRTWRETPLLQEMTFEEFKEGILPYRATDEQLTYSRSMLRSLFYRQVAEPGLTDVVDAIERYQVYIRQLRWLNRFTQSNARSGLFEIFMPQFGGDCFNATTWTVNFFRAIGIPVHFEFNPQWQHRDRRHFWCASPDASGILQPYTTPFRNLGGDWIGYLEHAGKVFRRGFAANRESPYFLRAEGETIPGILSLPVITDQTFRYHQTVTLRLPFNEQTNNNLAYLCFFTIDGLSPVAWGKIDRRRNQVVFEQVPVNVFFFPAFYDEFNELVTFGDPFVLKAEKPLDYIQMPRTANTNNTIVDLTVIDQRLVFTDRPRTEPPGLMYKPAVTSGEKIPEMFILRKYPKKRHLALLYPRFRNAVIVGSNHPEGPFETLFRFTDAVIKPWLQEHELTTTGYFRYYSFFNRHHASNINRLEFLAPWCNHNTNLPPMPLPVFPNSDKSQICQLVRIDGIPFGGDDVANAFDTNPNNFVNARRVGLDFGSPVRITHIRMKPRNASNMIDIGDRYQLWYFYDGEWNLFEEQVATYNYLRFENVPKGTIYWLKNLTKGREELPFFYENGKQRFIFEYNIP